MVNLLRLKVVKVNGFPTKTGKHAGEEVEEEDPSKDLKIQPKAITLQDFHRYHLLNLLGNKYSKNCYKLW